MARRRSKKLTNLEELDQQERARIEAEVQDVKELERQLLVLADLQGLYLELKINGNSHTQAIEKLTNLVMAAPTFFNSRNEILKGVDDD